MKGWPLPGYFTGLCCNRSLFHRTSLQICMICSAGYHTFNSHVNEKVAFRWYAVDLYGITVAMMGCYALGLYYGFYCFHVNPIYLKGN